MVLALILIFTYDTATCACKLFVLARNIALAIHQPAKCTYLPIRPPPIMIQNYKRNILLPNSAPPPHLVTIASNDIKDLYILLWGYHAQYNPQSRSTHASSLPVYRSHGLNCLHMCRTPSSQQMQDRMIESALIATVTNWNIECEYLDRFRWCERLPCQADSAVLLVADYPQWTFGLWVGSIVVLRARCIRWLFCNLHEIIHRWGMLSVLHINRIPVDWDSRHKIDQECSRQCAHVWFAYWYIYQHTLEISA